MSIVALVGNPNTGSCQDTSGGTTEDICDDGIDNDGDGLIDDKDPECLCPCDDTEGPVLLTGTPGQTGGQCIKGFDAQILIC